ncbi:hypothetical protein BDV18DRAFT_148329 [Aspergillus unguis]
MAPGSERKFKCSWKHCGKSFSRNADCCRHYRIHTNERPYQCVVEGCNKRFIQKSALAVHSRTHTGEKPYTCNHGKCYKAFSDSSSLARHRKIHTARRPYKYQEPSCGRRQSSCRETNPTKHQHRCVSVNRPQSEGTNPELSYLVPVTASDLPNDQHYPAQMARYPNFSIAPHGFSAIQNLPMTSLAGWAHPPAVSHNDPVSPLFNVQHALGQDLRFVQQQQYDQIYTGYFPVEYYPPYAQLTVEGYPLVLLP